MTRLLLAALGLVLLVPSSPSAASAGTPIGKWVQLNAPQATRFITFDSKRSRLIEQASSTQLWVASNDSIPYWSLLTGAVPPVVGGEKMGIIYEPLNDRLWMLWSGAHQGGLDHPARVFSMDLSAVSLSWVEHAFTGTAPFEGVNMGANWTLTLDTQRNRVIASGSGGLSGGGGYFALQLGDTPHWDSWLPPTIPWPPNLTIRDGWSMTYDPWHDRLLVYGGAVYHFGLPPTYYDETWALSFGGTPAWSFLPPRQSVPPARIRAASALDPVTRRWVVSSGVSADIYADTWGLDLSPAVPADSATWALISPGGENPSPSYRTGAIMWADSVKNRLVFYGGAGISYPPPTLFDSWALPMTPGPVWHSLSLDSLPHPTETNHFSFVDPTGGRLVSVFGSNGSTFSQSLDRQSGQLLGSTQVLFDAAGAVDPSEGRALLFGGSSDAQGNSVTSDLWSFPFADLGNPIHLSASGPPARSRALVAFDTQNIRLIVHGGRMFVGTHAIPLGDTWTWSAQIGWSSLSAGSYGGRWDEAGVYDPIGDRMVVFGGRDSSVLYTDVHELPFGAGGVWQSVSTGGTPPPQQLSDAHAVYDAVGHRMLLVGTDNLSKLAVWALTLDGSPTWSLLPIDGPAPDQHTAYSTAFDAEKGRILVTGGNANVQGVYGPTSEVWGFYVDETTPALLSLMSCDATADRVRIVWLGQPSETATAWRRIGTGGWAPQGLLLANARGEFVLEDHDVTPSVRYEYRLGIPGPSGETYTGDVFVTVPSGARLTLAGTVPQPAFGDLRIAFTLASAAPADLVVVDITGRRIFSRSVGELGAGAHVLQVEPQPQPGVYFLRLRQGSETRIARAVLLR